MAQKYSVPEREVRKALKEGISELSLKSAVEFVEKTSGVWTYAPLKKADDILTEQCHHYRAKIKRFRAGRIFDRKAILGVSSMWHFDVEISMWIKGQFQKKWIKIFEFDLHDAGVGFD